MKISKYYAMKYFILLLLSSHAFCQGRLIPLFDKSEYLVTEVKDYESLVRAVDTVYSGQSKVIYYKAGDNIFGFSFSADSGSLEPFVENTKQECVFFLFTLSTNRP
jgi:hypothetical protein